MYPIITISREFGSGGHTIAKKVSERLGIPFYDEAILRDAVKETNYDEDMVREKGEYASNIDRFFNSNFYSASYFEIPQDKLFRVQEKLILEYANKGPCVIVGRCGDYILDRANIPALNVFIHADEEHRKARVFERYGETDMPIEKRLAKKDKGRKTYYSYYTNRRWGAYDNYALNLDSGYLGEDLCCDIICQAAEAKAK